MRILVALLVGLALSGCARGPAEVAQLTGATMGTQYSVQLSPAPDDQTLKQLRSRIDTQLQSANQLFSTYIEDSALVRFNRNPSTDWQPVPAELAELVARAQTISELTRGHYDVTVGPLVELWGFGATGERDTPPTTQAIAEQLGRVGYQRLESRPTPPALRKSAPGLEIDLSSIAKGWAVDRIGDLLETRGFRDYLVEIGGETLIRGAKADDSPWRIAIERPTDASRAVQGILAPGDSAIATSGNYRNFFEHGGLSYGHTIDPQTGRPTRHRVASVTVIASDCTTADAWATALMALGEVMGPETAKRHGIAALFILYDGEGLKEWTSPAFGADYRWEQGH
jgi:thiamine biosynthesis lipoprotein